MAKIGSLVLLLICMKRCSAEKCEGVHDYKDEEGNCRKCETCKPGLQPSLHHCGYGKKEPLYSCLPCPSGSYSIADDYSFCLTCNPCDKFNSVVSTSCSSTSAAECGECYIGFFRPKKSDGNTALECFKCDPLSTHPECLRQPLDWKVIGLIMSASVVVLVALVFVCFCLWRRAKTRNSGSTPGRDRRKRGLLHKSSRDSEVVTSTSLEPLTSNAPCEGLSKSSSQHDLPPAIDPNTYSNLPTVEYRDEGAYPNLPTSQFVTKDCRGSERVGRSQQEFRGSGLADHEVEPSGRLDDAYRIDVDAFDTTSIQKVLRPPTGST